RTAPPQPVGHEGGGNGPHGRARPFLALSRRRRKLGRPARPRLRNQGTFSTLIGCPSQFRTENRFPLFLELLEFPRATKPAPALRRVPFFGRQQNSPAGVELVLAGRQFRDAAIGRRPFE